MAPADCVQKSALIIQLRFLLFISGRERRARRVSSKALKEQTAVFTAADLEPDPAVHTVRSEFIQIKTETRESRCNCSMTPCSQTDLCDEHNVSFGCFTIKATACLS